MATTRRRPYLFAATLTAVFLTGCSPQDTSADSKPAAPAEPSATASAQPANSGAPGGGGGDGTLLADAIAKLPVAEESRTGYDRKKFRHWIDEDSDGCSTRNEVLLAEAVTAPEQGARCALTGGTWHSYYDDIDVTESRKLDIDHMVPLAEAWDSGASEWTADRREAYANDLGSEISLVAVTGGSNRSKGDRDPADWLPPSEAVQCQYAGEWVATKLRWKLAADTVEITALEELAAKCTDTVVEYEVVS